MAIDFLKKPYPIEVEPGPRILTSIYYGLFVFFFLLFFQPFGLQALSKPLWYVCLGYAGITTGVMLFFNLLMILFSNKLLREEKWNSGREILWNLLNILLIALLNWLFSNWLGLAPLNARAALIFCGYTLAVGIFPIALSVSLKEKKAKKKFESSSEQLNKELLTVPAASLAVSGVKLGSGSGNEFIEISPAALIVIRADDNYVEVYYEEQGRVKKKLLRNSLKVLTGALSGFPSLYRCHKSYLVNLTKVIRVSGNAQGYRLHIKGVDFQVPVSRSLNQDLKENLSRLSQASQLAP